MTKLAIYSFVFFGIISCYPEEIFISPPGSIKSVHVTLVGFSLETDQYYYYNQKSQLVKIIEKSDKEDVAYTTYEYDKYDNLKRKEAQYIDGGSWTDYSYDAEGRVIKEVGSDGAWKMAYNENGRLMTRTRIMGGIEYEFRYDSSYPDRVSEELLWSSGRISEHLKYEYNANGQLIQKKVIDEEGLYIWTKEFFTYDNQGLLSSELLYTISTPYIGLNVKKKYYYNE